MVRAVIIGTGDHAHGLAHLFSINNAKRSGKSEGNSLQVTKVRGLDGKVGEYFHDTKVVLADFHDALGRADIVILAIPAKALNFFVTTNYQLLKDKILIDATNGTQNKDGEDLFSLLSPVTDIHWVKAFNDIGAVDALTRKATGKKKIPTAMCSPSPEALKTVKSFAERSLGLDVKVVPYEKYRELSKHQDSLGKEWVHATILMVSIFIVCTIYNIIRHPIIKGYPWREFPVFVLNKSISWAALWGFAVGQLPGMFARCYDAYFQDTLRTKPGWLVNFLAIRKHIGLVSLWFLTVHIFMSCLCFSIAYYSRFFYDPTDPMSRMSIQGELSFMFGSIGAALYIVLGICSLPSVAEQMTNRQWQFVYGPIAWAALICGTTHVICQGVGVTWDKAYKWAGGLPPITLVSTVFPMFVCFLKVLQMIFCRIMWTNSDKKKAYRKKVDMDVDCTNNDYSSPSASTSIDDIYEV